MKKTAQRVVLCSLLLVSCLVSAQENQISLFVNDMLKVADDFASPAAEGAAYLSGGGWLYSAKTIEAWNFDFSVQANVLLLPNKKRSVTVSSGDYSTFNIRDAETAVIPTAFGDQTDVVFEGSLFGANFEFDAIDGVEKKVLAHPFLQASVGLPHGSELTFRFSPNLTVDDVRLSTLGLGIKHNLNQYFFNSRPTDFQFAALVSYSNYGVSYAFTPVVVDYTLLGQRILVAQMEEVKVDADLWLLQLVTSKSFMNSNFEVFGALGATTSSFGYTVGGGGTALGEINRALESLDQNEMEIKGDIGLNYRSGNFLISSMVTIGTFINGNVGLHYLL